ncbi:MAG TPA: sigma-70 family RNA polymerase sigma factor [Mesorhizobium sp.]|nr:sigma-70 family RNA polymerase sigma factor [Mesorhizobium sp.]
MVRDDVLPRSFEAERERLRGVAYRMLGSLAEADDVLQEAWLRLQLSQGTEIGNFGGWLTTVVSRIALDLLRSRRTRREATLNQEEVEPILNRVPPPDPEQEALLAEAVGIGLMVVLDTLAPAERVAFVLHDLFGVSFNDVSSVLGCSEAAGRQLASRARRRIRDVDRKAAASSSQQQRLVSAFYTASRKGDFEALLNVLDPDVTLRIDQALVPAGTRGVVRGSLAVAKRAQIGASRAPSAQLLYANGSAAIAVAPFGQLQLVMMFVVSDERVREIEVLADPKRLAGLRLTLLEA